MAVRPSLVYRGAKEISSAAGISWKKFRHYVDEKALPAFRIDSAGPWLILPEDLTRWVEAQRDAYHRAAENG